MKIINTFPIESQAGSTLADPQHDLYLWRDIQIKRKKGGNTTNQSYEWINSVGVTANCGMWWSWLTSDEKGSWQRYADEYNIHIKERGRKRSAYNCFCCLQRVRIFYFDAGTPVRMAPHYYKYDIDIESCHGQLGLANYLDIAVRMLEEHEDCYIYIQGTIPQTGFLHSYRFSELHSLCSEPQLSKGLISNFLMRTNIIFNSTHRKYKKGMFMWLRWKYIMHSGLDSAYRLKNFQIA